MYIFLTLRSKTTTSGVVLAFVFEIVIHFFHTLPYVHEGILTECVYSKIQFERMNKENSTLHSPFTEQVKTKKNNSNTKKKTSNWFIQRQKVWQSSSPIKNSVEDTNISEKRHK